MIRLIVEVTAPEYGGKAGTYKTFDIVNKEFEAFLAANGFKPVIGTDIRPDPAPVAKLVDKVDVDAPPKNASALELLKHGKAVALKKEGKLPAKISATETLLEQYARYVAAEKVKSDAETAKNRKNGSEEDLKKRQEFNKRLKDAQAEWDRHSLRNRLARNPRPTKDSLRDEEKAAA